MDRYEEALAKARELNGTVAAGRDFLAEIFPELRESEDERVRKEMIAYFQDIKEVATKSENLDKWIAYLEKQKELDKMIVVSPEGWDNAINDAYENGKKDGEKQKEQKFTEKQDYSDLTDLERAIHRGFLVVGVENVPVTIIKETAQDCLAQMKPAEWSEDWREEDVQTRFAFYTYKDDPSVLYLSNVFVEEISRNHGFGTRILRAAEKVAEAIGATTISLKVKQNSPANAWYRKNGYGYVAFEDGYDWLEKNLEYMKPNKQEWSEEDKDYYDAIIAKLEVTQDDAMLTDNQMDFLKSLKNRGNPPKSNTNPPSWKPSEEQMGMLLAVINDPNNAGAESCHLMLQSLFADLQKLL